MNAINRYHLPADQRELLVQAATRAGDVRALRARDVERIHSLIRWAKNDAARIAYTKSLHDAMVALASANRVEQDAKGRLEQHLADLI